ncbi:MAG: hypothetical protein IH840_13465 [Candidatus Heimdallarchaeota archaeon]|nr:hypothetical protein [Candidatus Heimdallarchaeota archaeon]
MKKIYHDCLDPYFDPSEYVVLHSGGGNIPMRPNFDSLVFNGAMLTGDAGGLVDPTTFEGHGPALESGRLAGITLVKALQKESYRLEDLWDYNIAVMKYPGGMHTQSYLAAQLFRQIGSTGLHFVLDRKIITETELRSVFQQKNKSMNFRAKVKKLFKAFPRWKMMFTIRKYLDLIEQAEKIYLEYPGSPDKLQSWREKRNKKLKMHF